MGLISMVFTGCSAERILSSGEAGPKQYNLSLITTPTAVTALDINLVGRVNQPAGDKDHIQFEQQWPGVYMEAAFIGEKVYFDIVSGGPNLAVTIDDLSPKKVMNAEAGRYLVSDLKDEHHNIRVQVIGENQNASSVIGGIFIDKKATKLEPPQRDIQIEFIGDSHTVGYANTSNKRTCSPDEISRTTDTSLGIAGQLSSIYNADYQVNAISGRGVVRNYDGGKGATIPQQYPFTLLTGSDRYISEHWSPELFVISIGTNDFSTTLREEEIWKSRDALISDYELTYFNFVKTIINSRPDSHIIIWVAAGEDAEKYKASRAVVNQVKQKLGKTIGFLPVEGLSLNACNWHPTIEDAKIVVKEMETFINSRKWLERGL